MLKSIEVTAPSRELAIEKALVQLGMDRDSVSVEILDIGKKGFLGIGATDAKIRVSYEAPDEAPQAVPEPEKRAEAPKAAPAQPKAAPVQSPKTDDPRMNTPHLVKSATPADKAAAPAAAPAPRAPRPERTERTERPARPAYAEDRPRAPRAEQEPRVFKPVVPMDEAQVTDAGRAAITFIDGLLQKLDIEGKTIVTADSEYDHLRLDISGPDMGPVIGRRGDTLDAIQYLTSLVVNQQTEDHLRLTIDTENYRAKRAESLERLARKMAGKVTKYHKAMTLEPMNPYERRIIHSTLQEYRGVTTYSTGTEPGRRVVIAPEGSTARRNPSSRGPRTPRA